MPLWLKAAVFIGGSMVIGAVLAHLSGDAFWQKARPIAPPSTPSMSGPAIPGKTPGLTPSAEPPDHLPVKRPTEIIEDTPPPSGLSLKPPTKSGLRDLITGQGTDGKPK